MDFTGPVYKASNGVTFKLIKPPFCRFCHCPLNPNENYWRCSTCHIVDRDLGIRYSYDQARAAGVYSRKRRNSISNYIRKNKEDPSAAPILAEVMAHIIKSEFPYFARADMVVAVPTTQEKLEEKGFNHAQEIAEGVAKSLRLPLGPDTIIKNWEPAKAQHESNLRERFENVRGCFSVRHLPRWAETILLVDDTYITGASLNECSAVLKETGAARVFVMCAARGVLVSDRTQYLEEYFDA